MNTKPTIKRMGKCDIQASFLASIRNRLPRHLSFPDELAELLNISRDSAYRRLREETILSLDEARILSDRFHVSIDSHLGRDSGSVLFEYGAHVGPGMSFRSWMESILAHMKTLESAPGTEVTWHSKDLPIFHYFQFPRLAAFKLFWWMNLSAGEDLGKERYDEALIPSELLDQGKQIWDLYSRFRSTEIISRELLNTTLRQIEYSCDGGLLTQSQAVELCHDCMQLINRLEEQTQRGAMRVDGQKPGAQFDVYLNELLIGDNTILFQTGEKRTTFMTYNNYNFLSTQHESFCGQTEQFMKSLLKKSVLISRVAEKERIKFFNRIHRQIDELLSDLNSNRIAC